MLLEVSIGEAIDKYSILELKRKYITNSEKLNDIQKEIDSLTENCFTYIQSSPFFYRLLLHINDEIWKMTDKIKCMTPIDAEFAHIANNIFEYNQIRFRLKTAFNKLYSSALVEQKSYSESHCKIVIPNEECLSLKTAEINYLAIQYDTISFETPSDILSIIKSMFKNTNIIYDLCECERFVTIYLVDYTLPSTICRDVYCF